MTVSLGGRTGEGNAEASCGGTVVGGARPRREGGAAAGKESVPLGYTVRKCWTTLWGSLEEVRDT
jgi:hypothetical protein